MSGAQDAAQPAATTDEALRCLHCGGGMEWLASSEEDDDAELPEPAHQLRCGACGARSPRGAKPSGAERPHLRAYRRLHPAPPVEPLSARHRRIRELLDARGIGAGSDCTMLDRVEAALARRRLPADRQSVTHEVSVNGYEVFITVGLHTNGAPGEVFVAMAKQGSTLCGLMNAWSIAVSTALQYGTPLSVLVSRYEGMTFEPLGVTTNPEIPTAQSIPDYVARWMALRWPEVARSRAAVEVLDRVGDTENSAEGGEDTTQEEATDAR